jgi:hypothetical protein
MLAKKYNDAHGLFAKVGSVFKKVLGLGSAG